ncbi:MAG: hypothetical protein ACOYT4_03015 [Nanoarchaeota archaeon]
MRCDICRKEDIEFHEGIYDNKIVKVCRNCANIEDVLLIRKPTSEQLQKADIRPTVRERMENISGLNRISHDQTIATKNLAKIRFPEKKQEANNLIPNYFWIIQMTRRRQKIPLSQLAQKIGTSEVTLLNIEKGLLPKNFEQIIKNIEIALNVKLLKKEKEEAKPEYTQANRKISAFERLEKSKGKKEAVKEISKGNLDFSKKERLKNVTLNDLVDMKKEKEKRQKEIEQEEFDPNKFDSDMEDENEISAEDLDLDKF